MKKLLSALTVLALLSSFAHAQKHDTVRVKHADSNSIYTIVQQMPKFSQGNVSEYLSKNIHYPKEEQKKNITGVVYITFVVEKDGSVSGARVLRGVPGGPGLDAEALRVISAMPKWQPGMQNGKPVRVQYNIPIRFDLK